MYFYKKYFDFIIILLLTTVIVKDMYRRKKQVILSDTFSIIQSMRYELSFNARNYIENLDTKYLDSYFSIENARDGTGNAAMSMYPWGTGVNSSLSGLLNIFLAKDYPEEYTEIQNIYSKENDIIWTEIAAMNWINGNTDTADDNSLALYMKYSDKKFIKFPVHETDPIKLAELKVKAKDLLYGDSYVESCLQVSDKYKNIFKKILVKVSANDHIKNIIYMVVIMLLLTAQIFLTFFNNVYF